MENGKGRNDSAPVPGPSSSRPVFDSSSDTYHLTCLIEGESSPFPVTPPKESNIMAFKKLVHKEGINGNIDAADLVLLKVNIDLETLDEDDLVELSFTPDDEGVHKLKEWKLVSDYWSKQPENGRVHIFVKALATALPPGLNDEHLRIIAQHPTARKRILEDPYLDENKKRQKTNSPSTSTASIVSHYLSKITELHRCIQEISGDMQEYSDPSRVLELPFPSVNEVPPRFTLSKGDMVSYMGRKAFAMVWNVWLAIAPNTRQRQAIYVYGSRGYGKSHILAALACLLVRSGERVIYIPDCRAMLREPLLYLQAAFLFAFADPASLAQQEIVSRCETADALVNFAQYYRTVGRLCFIIDQLNALDPEAGEYQVTDKTKSALQQLLLRMSAGHVEINIASANHQSALHMAAKDTGDVKITLLGGQTREEMAQWWLHHHECFVNFHESDKRRVEDLTGCIPLFLAPFLKYPGATLKSLEARIWIDEPLVSIANDTIDFARKQQRVLDHKTFHNDYLLLMRKCLVHDYIMGTGYLVDHCYFYIGTDQCGNYTCGLARQAMMYFLREAGEEQIFLSPEWFLALQAFKHNPSVIGFTAEQIIISKIASSGIQAANLNIPPASITNFGGGIPAFSLDKPSTFYVPLTFNFKAIDLLYINVDQRKKTLEIIGIQITVGKEHGEAHADSEAKFYADWDQWTRRLVDFKITTSFLWIVEGKRGRLDIEAKLTKLRSRLVMAWPSHTTHYVSVEQVDEGLAFTLQGIRRDRRTAGGNGRVGYIG